MSEKEQFKCILNSHVLPPSTEIWYGDTRQKQMLEGAAHLFLGPVTENVVILC